MKLLALLALGIPIVAYAETHYSFKGIYSRLKKKEPEIIADVPFRIEPGEALPILILVKDAHFFPVKLSQIRVTVLQNAAEIFCGTFAIQETITEKFWYRIFRVALAAEITGEVEIDVAIEIEMNGTRRTYLNDNYRISSHAPFSTFLAGTPLPREPRFFWGDLHYHSAYTNDQVEFGAPLPATIELAQAMGLNFFAATEHSYDMDDHEDDYLKNDSKLIKWQLFQSEIAHLNQSRNFVIIPGEEVSAGNHRNQNIHFLIYNNPDYLPGKGDGAEKWLYNQPDLTIPEIFDRLQPQALAVAGHPEVEPPWLQKRLIRRGKWEAPDYEHPELTGLQIWNGRDDRYFFKGLAEWKKQLLRGRKLFIYAGNDAHGNFNRFRQIGFPFFTFREMKNEIFGYARTGVFCEAPFTLENLLARIRKGACVISNGPLLSFRVVAGDGATFNIGESLAASAFELRFSAQTTDEFGKIEQVKFLVGDFTSGKEMEWLNYSCFQDHRVEIFEKFDLNIKAGYLRGELETQKQGKRFFCFTNPLWFNLRD
jgi:hypothetical protein